MPEKITILLVEDNPLDQQAFKRFVAREKLPYDYTIASSMPEALQALREKRFDIVLSDYMLGDGTALDVIPHVADMPFVVITGSGDETTAVKAMKAGAYDYLLKDLQGNYLTTLPATVEKAIEHKRIEIALERHRLHLEDLVNERTAGLSQANEQLRESEERFRRLANNAPDIIFRYDFVPEMRLAFINPAVANITYYTPEECYADPLLMLNMAHPDDAMLMAEYLQLRQPPSEPLIMRWLDKYGEMHWMESRLVPIYDEANQLVAVEGITRDITKRKQAEELVQRSERRYATLFDFSHQLTRELEADAITQQAVSAITELGYWQSIAISLLSSDGKSFQDSAHNMMEKDLFAPHPIDAGIVGRAYRTSEIQHIPDTSADLDFFGSEETQSELAVPIKFEEQVFGVLNLESDQCGAFSEWDIAFAQSIAGTIAVALKNAEQFTFLQREITERKQVEEHLKYMSTHDSLTGLYNRGFFEAELKRLERGREFPVSILMADINFLKKTNDQAGHAAGDDLLKRVAEILTEAFRGEDVVARIGGDEFAVLLPATDKIAAEISIQRVHQIIRKNNALHDGIQVSISLGLSTADSAISLSRALNEADANMYRDKREANGY